MGQFSCLLADKESVLIRGVQSERERERETESGMCEWAREMDIRWSPKALCCTPVYFKKRRHSHRGFWPKYCHIHRRIRDVKYATTCFSVMYTHRYVHYVTSCVSCIPLSILMNPTFLGGVYSSSTYRYYNGLHGIQDCKNRYVSQLRTLIPMICDSNRRC